MPTEVDTDAELSMLRAHRMAWTKAWQPTLSLRRLMHNLQDPDFVAALDVPRDERAEPVRVNLDLPTRPERLASPLSQLQGLEFMAEMIERTKIDLVGECRRRGWSWAHIGEALGVARQSAWMKYAVSEED